MIAKIFIFISCPISTLTDLYYVGVQDGNLPSAKLNIVSAGNEHVARVQYGDNVVSGRIWERRFYSSLDGVRIAGYDTYEVSIASMAFLQWSD